MSRYALLTRFPSKNRGTTHLIRLKAGHTDEWVEVATFQSRDLALQAVEAMNAAEIPKPVFKSPRKKK